MRFLVIELVDGSEDEYLEVYSALANELGFTPMVWGTDDNEQPEAWKLPTRLLFAETDLDEKILNLKVLELVKGIWHGGCRSIVIIADGWHGEITPKPRNSVPKASMDQIEISRQD